MKKNLVTIVKKDTLVVMDEFIGGDIILGLSLLLTGDPTLGIAAMAPDYAGTGFRQLTYQAKAALTGLNQVYHRIKG